MCKIQGGYLGILGGCILLVCCLQHCRHSKWAEQSRAKRGHLCVHGLHAHVHVKTSVGLSMHSCERGSVCVWLNTAGHQQLWQASAVERDERCHSQVTPDHSQNDPFPSHFLSSSSPISSPFPVSHTWSYSLLLGLIGHENTQVCNDLATISTAEHRRWHRVYRFYDSCSYLSPNARQTYPLCLISTIMEH